MADHAGGLVALGDQREQLDARRLGEQVGGDRRAARDRREQPRRVGGALPFTSEFPLYLPGYFYGKLSTKDFGLAYGLYSIPFGRSKCWNVTAMAGTALVDYVSGLEQPGHWNSGVGGGVGYTPPMYSKIKFDIDYAMAPFGALGISHTVTVKAKW